MTHTDLLVKIENCKDLTELEELLDICVKRAEEKLKKYTKYLPEPPK